MFTAGEPVPRNGHTDEEEDQEKKEVDGQTGNQELEHGNQESDEIMKETEEQAKGNQLGEQMKIQMEKLMKMKKT
ncbi:hypothetical protein H5410_056204 [Solanum commersonii]|uniref:Uncharacterized protein n=1 Tax=Solanum commersonii TaxID=4109 RepID=A0A9J5WMF2_SOLCO|nr:hypothetical protein H5410_056204 [Solanum commersonii]